MAGDGRFADDFDGPGLDTGVWVPHYLPQWSSRAESAATYELAGSELRLTIPPGHGLWCAPEHDPLRVSGVQSGVFSGPVGSTIGQQPFRDGQVVREAQAPLWGWTPRHGLLEVRARMALSSLLVVANSLRLRRFAPMRRGRRWRAVSAPAGRPGPSRRPAGARGRPPRRPPSRGSRTPRPSSASGSPAPVRRS